MSGRQGGHCTRSEEKQLFQCIHHLKKEPGNQHVSLIMVFPLVGKDLGGSLKISSWSCTG